MNGHTIEFHPKGQKSHGIGWNRASFPVYPSLKQTKQKEHYLGPLLLVELKISISFRHFELVFIPRLTRLLRYEQ